MANETMMIAFKNGLVHMPLNLAGLFGLFIAAIAAPGVYLLIS